MKDHSSEVIQAYDDTPEPHRARNAEMYQARRTKALSLRLAGMAWSTIADQIGVSTSTARVIVKDALREGENQNLEEMRAQENARLDRVQAGIWGKVIQGDLKAIGVFLRISQQRAQLNGLNAPTRVDLSIGVRQEMEQALEKFEAVVLEGSVEDDPSGVGQPQVESREPARGDTVRTTVIDKSPNPEFGNGEVGELMDRLTQATENIA